jgi:hypothetical protein
MEKRYDMAGCPVDSGHGIEMGKLVSFDGPHLDLHRGGSASGFHEEIDLLPVPRPPIGDVDLAGSMTVMAEDLAEDVGLEQRASHRTMAECFRVAPPSKPCGKTGIEEEELGALDHPLRAV